MIVGIDEVGRGPWAGPLVFGAVVLGGTPIEGLTDSKKLSKQRREALNDEILTHAASVGLGWVSAVEIDEIGLSRALTLACRRALEAVTVPYEQIIIDGTVNFLKDTGKGPYVTTLAKADLLVPSVSAASIVAKVARDRYMAMQDDVYPGYQFGAHAGYGTAVHRQAIADLGITPLHRKSFAPIAAHLGSRDAPSHPITTVLAPTEVGGRGETAAAVYLSNHGFKVIERNWKTRACEIDIVAEKAGIIHFVEVKYRKNKQQGGGIAAITGKKLRQMERAAKLWQQRYGEHDARLSVVEVTGPDYEITNFLAQV